MSTADPVTMIRLGVLYQVARATSEDLSLPLVLEATYRELCRVFDISGFLVGTPDANGENWTVLFKVEQDERKEGATNPLTHGLMGHVIRTRKGLLFKTVAEKQEFLTREGISPGYPPAKSWMGVPLLVKDTLVGAMAVQNYESEQCYDEGDFELFQALASIVAASVRNAQLFAEEQRQNRWKRQLFSIIGHDLRGPLGAILSLCSVVINDGQDFKESFPEILKGIQDSASASLSLLENLLEWGRSQTETLGIRRDDVQLSHLFFSASAPVQALAATKNVRLDMPDAGSMTVPSDFRVLETIVRNLLSNAVKFSRPHTSVLLSAEFAEAPRECRIAVADQGVGMDAGHASKVFTPGANTRRRGTGGEGGAGLGLVLCADLAASIGARITVESALGRGSTFVLHVPVGEGSVDVGGSP